MIPTQTGPRRVVLHESADYKKVALIHPTGAVSIQTNLVGIVDSIPLSARELDTVYAEAKRSQPVDGAAIRSEEV